MKINPDSPDFQRHIDSATTSSPTAKSFADTLTSKSQPSSAVSNIHPFTAAAEAVSRQDLTDSVKANAAIDRAVQGIMEREFSAMCTSDRERVAAWLSRDPIMRAAILNHLMSMAE
jgi:hypothetical protein